MKRILLILAGLLFAIQTGYGQIILKQSTATTVNFKLTKISDGTDETGATIGSVTASLAKQSTTSSSTVTSITCAASATTHDCVHIAKGLYNMELTTGDTDTLGRMDLCVAYSGDYTDCTRYEVIASASYDVNIDGNVADESTILANIASVQADTDNLQTRVPSALDSNSYMKAGVPANGITSASFATDTNVYAAKVTLTRGASTDIYQVAWFKNEVLVTSGITSPQLQVVKQSDGTNLIAATAMTQVGSTAYYAKSSSTRITIGLAYIAVVTATIDGATRTWPQPVGRDN